MWNRAITLLFGENLKFLDLLLHFLVELGQIF